MQAYSKKTMMQIPPPSSHFSLFPEVFSPLNTNANNTGETTGTANHGKMKSHPEETPKKHNAYSSSFALRRSPSSSRSTIRYQESSHFHQAPMINHQVLRPQQQEHLPSRRMTRNRSPSQKIYSRSCGTTEGNENGNPQIQCPGMANPTSYLAKEYEKSTLRMLERIQKSRSFEKKNQTNAAASASNLHKSFSHFESSRNKNATFQQDNAYYTGDADSGFFIGGDEEDNYFCHSNFDHHMDRFDQDRFGGLGDLQHGVPILEQENNDTEDDEIFELDL